MRRAVIFGTASPCPTFRMVLEQAGYDVVSVVSNEEVFDLEPPLDFDAVVIGHAAPKQRRETMAAWIKQHVPHARIVTLQSANTERLQLSDLCADPYEPEQWLSAVARAVA